MGNDLSCINSTSLHTQLPPSTTPYIARNRSRSLITIVSPLDGRACYLKEPLNVGELMLEAPGNFVAEFGQEQDGYMLRSTRRISALPADSNLHALHVYYVLPMNRLNTRLATHELRKIVMATRLATPHSAPYPAQMQSSKITPLPPLQCKEAVKQNTKKRQVSHRRQGGLHRRQPVQARTYRCEQVLGKDKLQRGVVEKVREIGGGSDDPHNKQAKLVLHSQRAMSKPRTWAPKLDTIMELTLEPYLRK